MVIELIDKLANKSLTKEQLFEKIKKNYDLLPEVINGMTSSEASIRYDCGKVLMDLSEENPKILYPHMNFFVEILDSKYRILTWQAMAIIANLTRVDKDNKFDEIFDKYYSFINNEYMVTVANLVAHSGKIALAKPHLTDKIVNELLKVEDIKTTPHLTSECKNVITEKAILSFGMFFDQIKDKNVIFSFVKKQLNSPRKTLRFRAIEFLKKWNI